MNFHYYLEDNNCHNLRFPEEVLGISLMAVYLAITKRTAIATTITAITTNASYFSIFCLRAAALLLLRSCNLRDDYSAQ